MGARVVTPGARVFAVLDAAALRRVEVLEARLAVSEQNERNADDEVERVTDALREIRDHFRNFDVDKAMLLFNALWASLEGTEPDGSAL